MSTTTKDSGHYIWQKHTEIGKSRKGRQMIWGLWKSRNNTVVSSLGLYALISHASEVMLKILQARLQRYMNWELPDVQVGFRKGRGTRDQIANVCWIIEKTKEFQENICFIDCIKASDYVDHKKLWKILKEMGIPDHLTCLLRNLVCRSGSNS